MRYTLGIDIGTYEAKGCLVDETGRVMAEAARRHDMQIPEPGYAEHDAEADWWQGFVTLTRELLAKSGIDPKEIAGVGISGIGPCMLPVDAAGQALMNGVLYGVDTRASREIAELTAEIGVETLLRRTGNGLTSQSVGPKMLWLKRNRPEIFARTTYIMNSTTWLVFRLTGRVVIDHYSASSYHPYYDIESQSWTRDYDDLIAPAGLLPALTWATDIAGYISSGAARLTGLAEGTPVIAGTIDAAAEAVSVGVQDSGQMMLMYGSSMFLILVTGERIADPRLWYAPWLFPGQHALMSGTATAGTLTRWFVSQFARDLPETEVFELLSAEAAASPPGARGLVMLPYFSGERTPIHDAAAKGIILGLDLSHQRGDLYRALLEGVGYGIAQILDTYKAAGARITEVIAVGGGTRNSIWAQGISDITGREQTIRSRSTGAAYGDAFLAAVGVGMVAPRDITRWNPSARALTPDPDLAQLYQEGAARFQSLYHSTRPLLAGGNN